MKKFELNNQFIVYILIIVLKQLAVKYYWTKDTIVDKQGIYELGLVIDKLIQVINSLSLHTKCVSKKKICPCIWIENNEVKIDVWENYSDYLKEYWWLEDLIQESCLYDMEINKRSSKLKRFWSIF